MSLSSSSTTPIRTIEDLLELRRRYGKYLSIAFRDHSDFQRSLKTAFETFLNRDTRASRFLAIFLDDLIKQHQSNNSTHDCSVGATESESIPMLERRISDAILLFR